MRARYGMLLSAVLATGLHAEPRHYVELINDAPSSVQTLQVAPAGSEHWETLEAGMPLRSGDSVRLELSSEGGCSRDFHMVFADGRAVTQRFGICRYGALQTLFYWRHAAPSGSTG